MDPELELRVMGARAYYHLIDTPCPTHFDVYNKSNEILGTGEVTCETVLEYPKGTRQGIKHMETDRYDLEISPTWETRRVGQVPTLLICTRNHSRD